MINEVADKDPDGKPKEEGLPPKPPRSNPGPGRNGRNGADAYTSATRVAIELHAALKPGCNCPSCLKGKLSRQKPRTLVRIKGMAPLTGTVYERECVRCNLCGEIFTAEAPAEAGLEKYDASVSAMIGILKFGYGIPYDRLGRMQKVLGIPMPPSTQYEILEDDAITLKPIHKEMLRRVAQAAVSHTDDTSMKILKVKRDPEDDRTGLFTTGIVGVASDHKIGLFFTGTKHSGENLAAVLEERAAELESPPDWAALNEQWTRSGLAQKEFCRRQGVSYQAFLKARREYIRAEAAAVDGVEPEFAPFIPVNIAPPQPSPEIVVELPMGVTIRFRGVRAQ